MHPELHIFRVHWPKVAHSKRRSSLIMELVDVRAVNRLVDEGFLGWTAMPYLQPIPSSTPSYPVLSTEYQHYKHIAKQCKAKVHCAHCVGAHFTKDCKTQQKWKCAVCKGNHKAWSLE